jgi:hypothetical protein
VVGKPEGIEVGKVVGKVEGMAVGNVHGCWPAGAVVPG